MACTDTSFPVFGSVNNYADQSSICRAGIHAGVIDGAIGGELVISYNEDVQEYFGSIANSIESLGIEPDKNGVAKS
jgi:hypothetical protein